jgi:hypothetical protein
MFGVIEIERGEPIKSISRLGTTGKFFTSSYLLNKKVTWTIEKIEVGHFAASTNENGDLNAMAFSRNRNEIDSLISIIATLRTK